MPLKFVWPWRYSHPTSIASSVPLDLVAHSVGSLPGPGSIASHVIASAVYVHA